jgi:hypothetical protein
MIACMTNTTEPLTRAQAIAIDGKPLCQPNGCHEDDLEPNLGNVAGWWMCKRCGSALTSQVAQAFTDEPLSYVNQAIQWMHAGTMVLHVQAMIVARVQVVNQPGEYTDLQNNTIDRYVVELDDGNAFILPTDERVLVPLTALHVKVFEQMQASIRQIVIGAFAGIRTPTRTKEEQDERMAIAVLLLRAALTQQLRALGT